MNVEKKKIIKIFRIETIVVLVISCLINFSIVGIFANSKFDNLDINLKNAGNYLTDFLRTTSKLFWGLGLLAAGLSSTTTGALTG